MSVTPIRAGSRRSKHSKIVEWVGGITTMPAYVTGEGEPYQPEVLLWLDAEGAILGTATERPGELLALASRSLSETIARPMYGKPHSPTRVRVSSEELAAALREGHPGLEVVCAPTPELDAMLAHMQEHLGPGGDPPSYMSLGLEPPAIASFFSAAAALYKAAPWKVVPDDQCLIAVTVESMGLRDAAMSVIGQMGESLGLILFSGLDDFEAYIEMAEAFEAGEEPVVPAHFSFSFGGPDEVPEAVPAEVREHGWELVSKKAYPWLMAVDAGLVTRPADPDEVTLAEAVARAMVALMADKKALRAAFEGGPPVALTHGARTHDGFVEVTLRAPYVRTPKQYAPDHDLVAELAALREAGPDMDHEERADLEAELTRRFLASPEAEGLADMEACSFVMDLAATHHDETIATLQPSGLRTLLFQTVPAKVSVRAADAGEIIAECRAFYAFLKREFGLAQADACLALLDDKAVAKLEAGLSDESNFSPAKAFVMAGARAGFDMNSQEGIEAWLAESQGQLFGPASQSPKRRAPSPPKKPATNAEKNKQKAKRKASKKKR